MNKILAIVVFLVLLFLGTYFAKVSHGGVGAAFLGYTLGALAFIVAPMIWKGKSGKREPPPEPAPQPFAGFQDIPSRTQKNGAEKKLLTDERL